MKKGVLLFGILFTLFLMKAQNFTRPGEWKKYKREVFVTMGASNFLGDLGGRDNIGKHFSPVDMNLGLSRTAFGAGGRLRVERWCNVVGKFSYLLVKGDDAKTNEVFRNNRNLNFKSNIFELSGRVEIGWQSSRLGNRYGIKRTLTGNVKRLSHNIYGFVGVGVFYFNPKGKTPDGKYVKLRPLHTEGQGLPGGPKQYSRISASIPVGIYYKCIISKIYTAGIELSWRKTFTDYIDDVSTKYYDPVALAAAYGPLSATMADPSKGAIPGATSPDGAGNPAVRGDSNKDSYVSLELTFGYIIKEKRKKSRLRSKF